MRELDDRNPARVIKAVCDDANWPTASEKCCWVCMVTIDHMFSRIGGVGRDWYLNDDISRPGKNVWFFVKFARFYNYPRFYITDGKSLFYEAKTYKSNVMAKPRAFKQPESINHKEYHWMIQYYSSSMNMKDVHRAKRKIRSWARQQS